MKVGPWLRAVDSETGFGPDISLEEAQAQLPGWVLWHTSNYLAGNTYSARPSGTHVAARGCSGMARVDALVKAVKEYEANLGEHIDETRSELADTPPSWVGRVEMLTERLMALEEMAHNRRKYRA